jgi:hypothetical protein
MQSGTREIQRMKALRIAPLGVVLVSLLSSQALIIGPDSSIPS